jgi:hypothetical protein
MAVLPRAEAAMPASIKVVTHDIPSEMFVSNAAQYLDVKGRVRQLNQFIEEHAGAVSKPSVQHQRPHRVPDCRHLERDSRIAVHE